MSEIIVQGTEAWMRCRLGKVTASRVADVVAKTKTGPSASRATYMGQLIAERLSGTPGESFSNAAMQWGTDKEPDARRAYSFIADCDVDEIGFVEHPVIPMTGASPDGLVRLDGLVEIKCPNTATHVETLLSGSMPAKHHTQIQWQLACSGRAWCDFVSFDPRLPEAMQLFVQRVDRDAARIAELETEVRAFLAELDAKVGDLRRLYEQARAA